MDFVDDVFLNDNLVALQNEFETCLMDNNKEKRQELAQRLSKMGRDIGSGDNIQNDQLMKKAETVCMLACVLDPKDINCKKRWARALSFQPMDEREGLIDRAEKVVTSILLQKSEQAREFKGYIYNDGRREVLELANDEARKRFYKESKKAFVENMEPESAEIPIVAAQNKLTA